MVGTSLPPSINLNVETLDMDCVYINKTYNYEIVAINKGHINGVLLYKEVPTLFGSVITCSPELHCLRPGDREIFVISFSNSNQGPYFEEINFAIRDSDVVLKLYLKGEVIYPSLMFSIPCLDFGMVSVGVPKTLELDVINESVVNVNASVKISSDGPEISSITLIDYAVAEMPKPKVPQWPREFNIEPCKIDMAPESRVSLKVTLTANLIRANQTSLELELEKSDSPPIILPVTFDARVPELIPASDIKLRACFLDFPYQYEIQVTSNEFQGYFTMEDQDEEETLEVTVGLKEGVIEPNSILSFPVTVKTGVLGVQEYTIRLNMFGLSKSIEICHITGCGVRPIVTCSPMALHWGQIKLLTKSRKILTLCNDSPVYVYYKAALLNRDGRWQIHPSEGHIEPEAETELVLTLYLFDADTYTNKVVIQLEKVKDILVPLSATGVGTSIIVGELRDRVVLGRHFTRIPLDCKVVLENCGTRMHALEWSEHYKAPKNKPLAAGFFNLEPRMFKMAAGEKMEMAVSATSHKVTTVKEMWYLVGSVEGINKKELLLECEIMAEFVDPKIEVSSSVIEFRYDYGPYSEYYKLTDIVTIKNVSKLPLDMEISVKPPFALIQKQSTYKISPEDEQLCCCICYNEADLNVPNIINENSTYQSKVFLDYLTLKPVEPLRKGPLKFFQDINKIKMAFNLTHTIEERLEDQELMKLQVLLDTTKHLSLKSRVYCELMRNKFKGHKNKDAIKLIGKINFPNMFILSPRVDFQCILNGSIESKTIKVQNVTPLLVCYKFQWKKCFISRIAVPEMDFANSKSETQTPTNDTDDDRSVYYLEELTESRYPVQSTIGKTAKENDETLNDLAPGAYEPVGMESLNLENIVDLELVMAKVIKKVAPMITKDYDTEFPWICKFPKLRKENNRISTNEILQLTPHRGILKPNECQYIHVIFTPKPNISVRAVLECEVLGGPSEYIAVTGQSSELMYKINTQKLNFKIRSFHENASEKLILTNIAQLVFEYKTYLNEPKFENELEGTILDLVPPEKTLEPEEEAEMKIVMRPGVVGYFRRVFLLEMGHLPHIPIEVFGWGVIPQVYILLKRPEIVHLHPELGYLAIQSLSHEYLEAVNEIFTKGTSEHLNSPLGEKCFEDPDLQRDWYICSTWDRFPSTMDIELAIERMLVINHIRFRPEILTAYSTTSKMGPIPGFHTTPYVIDFGVVITGSTVQCVAEIINYGPIVTKLHFAKGTQVPMWLGIKLCGKLNPGESGKLEVTFSPTSIDFTELEQDVETYFNLEVPYGVTTPIKIKALCAVPYLSSNVSALDFGSVRCGDKIISSIPLKNVGKPTCIWYVTLRLKTTGHNPMMVLNSSGKYEPGEGGWLSIAFKPATEMTYEGLLIFRFHMNPNRMTIPVMGQGILPHVHIIGPNVSFPPTLPWAETTDIYFGLTNPCPFPLELIFAHSDQKWKQEDNIYQLLFEYYDKPEEMLVPAIKPGAGLPYEIYAFFKKFTDNVKKTIDEEAAAAKAANAKGAGKKAKPAKPPPKSAKGGDKGVDKGGDKAEAPVRKFRTEAQIIADEMKLLKDNNVDPLQECLEVFGNETVDSDLDLYSKGMIVFFHGSPCEEMQGQELAYTLGKSLHLPTVSIDVCIVEALCSSNCSAKETLVSTINEMYQLSKKSTNKDDDADEDEEEDRSKSLLVVSGSESKKKINKKEETRGKPTNEYVMMNTKYNEYTKNIYENLVNIANNWVFEEGDVGVPLYGFTGQVIGTAQKKTKKKSDIHVQMSDVGFEDRGFPVTLIMCPCLHYKEALMDMFATAPFVQVALKEEEPLDVLKCPVKRKEFTVLLQKTMPYIHHEEPLKWCFLDEMPVASSQTSTSEIPSTSLEKVPDEESEDYYPCPQPLCSVKTVPEYGKLLLYRREDDRFIVKNDSILSIMWKVRNAADFVEDFIIAQTSGIVPRHDNQVVPVTYIACRVGVISNKILIIDIYDAEGRGDPMVIDQLSLSAECYDVMVECAYENPAENFLNYGNVFCEAEAFMEDVILVGLEMLSMDADLEALQNSIEGFIWEEVENLVVKPAVGYISPGEEKDLEIMFFSAQPVSIKKKRRFSFKLKNIGHVPMKIVWSFQIDEDFPARIDKNQPKKLTAESKVSTELDSFSDRQLDHPGYDRKDESKVTLFSGSVGRDSVDTWFEVNLPFTIEPAKDCLDPDQTRTYTVTFAPLDAFDYKVRLKSFIDNLDPYDLNISCKLTVKSLIPYCHLDIEESDYITSGRRKSTGVALPPFMTVLEFNVLGSGCYKNKVPIDATFIFKDMYPVIDDTLQSEATSVCLSPSVANLTADPGPSRVQMLQNYKDDKVRKQIAMDIQNALSSLKVVPSSCKILPHRKVPLKIHFKPVGMISTLNAQILVAAPDFR
ncbi:hypothetical protein MSG28_002349 [Choristoneura fumiferana]|uniref:Uncharacterized protein n=1 Tax=Choristoneura fumiferana TaxID=7141 RepID=A0ACC0JVX6_CHOFU|nr:hypothetical protein MSG28_002349 [Choristoneura fumiferana]